MISTHCWWKRFYGVEIFRQAPKHCQIFPSTKVSCRVSLFFQFTYLICVWTGTWSMPMTTGFRNIWISFFLSQNLPALQKVSFAAVECWQQICSSASASHLARVKILKQFFETRIGENLLAHVCKQLAHIRLFIYAAGSHSLMCMCYCPTFTYVNVYAVLTFDNICVTVALHSLKCMSCSLTFAHLCMLQPHIRSCVCFTPSHSPQRLHNTQYGT